jgi:hypothetical protein
MATLASVVKKYRQQGQGRGGALASGASDILRERIDPRRFLFKSDGVMSTLFPALKSFKAKGAGEKGDLLSSGSAASTPVLNEILINSEITAKNTASLPMMGRDMNVMRQGILKLVKLQGGTQRDKADRFFMGARDREALYESQFGKKRGGPVGASPIKEELGAKPTLLTNILKTIGIIEIIKDLMPILKIIGGIALPAMSLLFGSILPLIVGATAIAALTQLFGDWKKGKEEKEDIAYLKRLKDEGKELTATQQAKLDDFMKKDKSLTPGEGVRKSAKGMMTLGGAKEFLDSDLTEEEIKDATGASRKVLEEYVKRGGKTAIRELSLEMGETPGGNTRAPKAEKGKADAGQSRAEKVKAISESGTAREVMEFFMNKGWTKEQAAGITGNLQAESNFKTDAIGDGGKAYGIAQWHPDRQAIFENVYGKKLQEAGLQEQLEFVDWELRNSEKRAGDILSNTKSAAEAAAVVDQLYERSSGAHRQKRIDIASSLVGVPTILASSVPVSPSSGSKVSSKSQEVAVAQRNEGGGSSPVVIADNKTINNSQVSGGGQNGNIASPYNDEMFEMLFKMATS